MKKSLKKACSVALVMIIMLAACPFSTIANALVLSPLSYEINNNEVTITNCDETASGVLTIPTAIDGYKVTTIKDYAFNACKKITEIVVPDGVTTIGSYAFSWCDGLTKVTLPNSITSLGVGAFIGCSVLKKVSLPMSITKLSDAIFSDCTSLTSVALPTGITAIGQRAFDSCTSLKSIVIPDSVVEIGTSAFRDCKKLIYVSLPSEITCLSVSVFSGCSSLTNIELTEKIESIGAYSFLNCTSLEEILIPSSTSSISGSAFDGCTSLNGIYVNENNAKYSSDSDGILYSADKKTLIMYPIGKENVSYTISDNVTEIGNYAFKGSNKLKEIIICDGLKKIGQYSFLNCTNIDTIRIPKNVEQIDTGAFMAGVKFVDVDEENINYSNDNEGVLYNADKTRMIQYPNANSRIKYVIYKNTRSIAANAFYESKSLQEITIPDSVKYIGDSAFCGCSSLRKITLPDSVSAISYNMFKNCSQLNTINLGKYTTEIKANAFNSCSMLKELKLPDSITEIQSEAFINCSNLIEITIPGNVSEINTATFSGCRALKNVIIGESVNTIYRYAFEGCYNIETLTIPCSTTVKDKTAFGDAGNIQTLNITVGTGLFADHWKGSSTSKDYRPWRSSVKSIKRVYISEGVSKISRRTFKDCYNLEEIHIPKSIKSIDSQAFYGCEKLNKVFISSIEAWCGISFSGQNSNPLNNSAYLYLNNSLIENLVIPDGVKKIAEYSFINAKGISKISIPDSVTQIGSNAFWGTDFYNNEDYWDNNVLYINNHLIKAKNALEGYYIVKEGTKTIACDAFRNDNELRLVFFPESLNYIGNYAFYGCSALEMVIIPNGVIQIGNNAFEACHWHGTEFFGYDGSYAQQYCTENNNCIFSKYMPEYTFDSMGGSTGRQKITCNSIYVPTDVAAPVKEGVFFDGWYDSANYGNMIGEKTPILAFYLNKNIYYHYYNPTTGECSSTQLSGYTEYHEFSTYRDLQSESDGENDKVHYTFRCPDCNKTSSCYYKVQESEYIKITGLDIYAHWIKSIKVNRLPNKTKYFVGDKVDTSGLQVTVLYDNGDVTTLDSGFEIKNKTLDSVGNQLVTVNYKGATTSYAVNVSPVTPDRLSVESMPLKTEYYVGDSIDLNGLKVRCNYSNNDSEIISEGYDISSVDMSTAGEKNIVISYKGLNTSFKINVYDVVPVSAKLVSKPNKTDYFVGDRVDLSGIKMDVTYNNGKQETITTGFSCSKDVFDTSGDQLIEIEYKGVSVFTNVSVHSIIPSKLLLIESPNKTVYYVDDTLQTGGLVLAVKYNNGMQKNIKDNSSVNYKYDFSSTGNKNVEITYSENGILLKTDYTVSVIDSSNIYSEKGIVVNSGEEIKVPIYISGNNGMSGFRIKLTYDVNSFTPMSVTAGSLLNLSDDSSAFSMLESNAGADHNGVLDVVWTSTENIVEDGVLFYAHFKVSSSASGNKSIVVEYDSDSTFNSTGEPVKLNCSNVELSVKYVDIPTLPMIRVDGLIASPGEEVYIPVRAFNLSATDELEVNIGYNKEYLSLMSIESGYSDKCIYKIKSNGVRVSITELEPISDTTIFIMKFKVSENAFGDYDFNISAENSELSETIFTEAAPLTVFSVTEIYGKNIRAEVGSTSIAVPISLKNNHGIMGCGLYIDFDPNCFAFKSISQGTALSEGNFDYNLLSDGHLYISWVNSANSFDNGEVFTVYFSAKKKAPMVSNVKISYDKENTFNENWDDVKIECASLKISTLPNKLIFAKESSGALIRSNTICGLRQGLNTLDDYIGVYEGFDLDYSGNIGTSTVVCVKLNDEIVEQYEIVLFGDVNGDGWYDGRDAVTVSMIANGMLSREQVGEAVWMAADCNHDGKIDQADVDLLNQAGLLLSSVDQTKPTEELLKTSSEYNEYLNLIDQSVEVKSDEPEQESPETQKPSLLEFLLTTIWNYIKLILSLIK